MQLLIEISEELYNNVVEHAKNGYIGSDVWIAVANGKPYNPSYERPKGEWKVRPHTDADGDCDGYEMYCSECGHVKVMLVSRSITLDEATERLKSEHKNFCLECGADMRGDKK